jgi:hypothetical protein
VFWPSPGENARIAGVIASGNSSRLHVPRCTAPQPAPPQGFFAHHARHLGQELVHRLRRMLSGLLLGPVAGPPGARPRAAVRLHKLHKNCTYIHIQGLVGAGQCGRHAAALCAPTRGRRSCWYQ